MTSRVLAALLLTLGVALLTGCVARRPVPELTQVAAFVSTAAQYETTYEKKGQQPRQLRWRLWRERDRIVTENLTAHTAELWQRDGTAIFHRKIFHEDRCSIEYRAEDLALTATDVAWSRRSLLIEPELLSQLKLRQTGWKGDVPFRRYVGDSNGSAWDITIRTDLMLPITIVRTHDGVRERTQLQNAYELRQAPWAPTPFEEYLSIDFADLGDRATDPFVMKVQAQLGSAPHLH